MTVSPELALLPLLAPASLLGVTLLAHRHPGLRPWPVKRAAALAASAGVLIAAGSAGAVATAGSVTSPLLGASNLGFSLRLDGLIVTIFAMVTLLAVVILRFSGTYLDGDPRQGVFLGRLTATIAAVEILVLANNLLLFLVAWVATSLCLHKLLVFYPSRRRAVVAAKKKFLVARIGDAALAVSFAWMFAKAGTGELDVISQYAVSAGPSSSWTVAATLIVVAALLKSAQFPTHSWLVEVMETPTPVSALLHAGVLNAGPFVVLRFAPVMELAVGPKLLLVAVGGLTALLASAMVLTQPTVKVGLGYSSAAHMGFTLLVCGLGVYPAAVLHLVAHSFYKAHAFLSAGSTVDVARAQRVRLSSRFGSPLRIAAGLLAALLIYLAVATTLDITPWSRPSLLAVGGMVVLGLTHLLSVSFDTRMSGRPLLYVVAATVFVTLAFFGLEEAVRLALGDALPRPHQPSMLATSLALSVFAAFAAVAFVQLTGWGARTALAHAAYVHLRNGLYANVWFDRLVGAFRG